MDFDVLGEEDLFHLRHELQTQVAVVEDDPVPSDEAGLDHLQGRLLHLLSHRHLPRRELLLLLRKLINAVRRVSPRRQQVEHRPARRTLLPDVRDRVSHWQRVLITQHLLDELDGGQQRPVFPQTTDQAQPHKVADLLVVVELFFILVGNDLVLWVLLIGERLPHRLSSADPIRQLLKEHGVVVVEFVLGEGLQVEPGFLVDPVEGLVPIINPGASLQEHSHIASIELSFLDQDLQSHHQFEGDLVGLEEASVDVSVDLPGELCGDIVHSVLHHLRLRREINGIVEQTQELLQRGVVHPVH
mmetsp:Transcript_44091/g.42756  ORF Transcript_44091/g.42756 Transcript_44091/m.42756 type:complete len:301 (-) Transcript_44091:2470-3372(-)